MKFYIHKLGCPKNDVDADYMAARLIDEGHRPVAEPEEAEAIIVNTCGFILPAKEESIESILNVARLKESGSLRRLYITGCLSQRYGDELLGGLPEADGAFGLGQLDSLAHAMNDGLRLSATDRIEARKLTYLDWPRRHIADDLPYAYLKISDGCNRRCSYCVIPQIRGAYRSRSLETIVDEAAFLADQGKKELILVSQEATLYGHDLRPRSNVIELLGALDEIDAVEWIRLMYLHPAQVSETLLDHMAGDNKTLPYFDLPLQHINTEILHAMGRVSSRDEIERLLDAIRDRSPESVLRATFIVGFPGETEAQFEELLQFIEERPFERLAGFAYSEEEGTPAAARGDQVPEKVRFDRLDRLMSTQQQIAFDENTSLIGKVKQVIIDAVDKDRTAVGRTQGDCPEIDQEVFVTGTPLEVGQLCSVRIESVEGYDLRGVVVGI